MKILVTGANGFVGEALCQQLTREGHLVNRAVRNVDLSRSTELFFAVGACDATTNWGEALKYVEVVVHAAARVHVMVESASNPLEEFRRVNVQGTLELARQAAAAGVRRFVFISSVKVNGETTLNGVPFTECDQPSPIDNYGISKYEAELGLKELAVQTGLELVIIRPPLIYGPGVKANFASLLHTIKRGVPLPLGSIRNQRSMVGMGNLCSFISLCMAHGNAVGQTFLISDGEDVSTSELVFAMIRALNLPARFMPRAVSVPQWLLRVGANSIGKGAAIERLCGNLQVDIRHAKKCLEWTPPYTLEEGLKKCVI